MKIVITIKSKAVNGKRPHLKRAAKMGILNHIDIFLGCLLDKFQIDISRKVTYQ